MTTSAKAGLPADTESLIDVSKLVSAYFSEKPDPSVAAERVSFGTSGHRGSSLKNSFNEDHILAITQAICDFRRQHQIEGPLFLGMDTHALSRPAHGTALEVLAANGVDTMISENSEYTPTPVISHAILTYNNTSVRVKADGIVITPSHNPPADGGFKYNPPHGGPAETTITTWIEQRANLHLDNKLANVKKVPHAKALSASTTHRFDYLHPYVNDLPKVIDLNRIRDAKLHAAVDPLGGAGVDYWGPIAEVYGLDLTIINKTVDPTFRFMSVDWDGQIRMDPSSPYAMHKLVNLKEHYDIAFACDTDHDRHGIVTKSVGLMQPNHYLAAAIYYLFSHRPDWDKHCGVGKTVVSSQMIDRIAGILKHDLIEVPVGFKWFVEGLLNGSLGFVGEESAGASFLRMNGRTWTTDKDGIIAGLLAAEITAVTDKDPGEIYRELTERLGQVFYGRVEAKITAAQKKNFARLSADMMMKNDLAGEKILSALTNAPSNHAPIGGIKALTKHGWFAARPSGTEDVYKIYAESYLDENHLQRIISDAQQLVDKVLL